MNYWLYLLWPFISIIPTLSNFRKPAGKVVFILIFAFIGFTCPAEGDLDFYARNFYVVQDLTLSQIINSFINLSSGDIFLQALSIAVGFFFNNHHIYFAFIFGIWAYFYSGFVNNILKIFDRKWDYKIYLLNIGFALFMSIAYIYNTRFYLGIVFYSYFISLYLISRKSIYLIIASFSFIFHFSLSLLSVITPAFYLLRNKSSIVFAIFLGCFFISQTFVTSQFRNQLIPLKSSFLENKYKAYVDEKGRKLLDQRYENDLKEYNTKAIVRYYVRETLLKYILLGIILCFLIRKEFLQYLVLKEYFVFTLLTGAAANIMVNISNGGRFQIFFGFVAMGFFTIIYKMKLHNDSKFRHILKWYFELLIPLALINGITLLVASNSLFTSSFYFSNIFIELLSNN